MVRLEADLGLAQGVDEMGSILPLGGVEATLDGVDEAGQLGPVLVAFTGPLDGRVQLVKQASQVLFHARTLPRHRLAAMNPQTDMAGPDLANLVATMPFAAGCGVELVSASPAEVTGRLAWTAERCTAGGVLHGGALMTLADTMGAVCAYLNLPPGATTSTIESKTNFFRTVRGGHLHGVTRSLHVGRTTIAVQTDLRDDDGRPVATVIQTQAVLARS